MKISALALRSALTDAWSSLGNPGAQVRFPRSGPTSLDSAQGHFHLRPEFFFQQKGTTRFRFFGEDLTLTPGEILVIPPLTPHEETTEDDAAGFHNVVLYADETSLTGHLADRGPGAKPRVIYPESVQGPLCGRVASWLGDAVRVAADFEDAGVLTVDLVRAALRLSLKLLDQPVAVAGGETLLVARCRRMIHEDLGNAELSVGSLAHRLGCHADYLSHHFRSSRKETLSAHILGLRMDRAAELLTATSLAGKEVAWACGFASYGYFIRCFRERWGVTPGAWWSATDPRAGDRPGRSPR